MDSTTDKQSRRGRGRTNKAEWGYIITLSTSIFFFALIYIILYLLGRLKSLRSFKFQEQISIEVNVICSTKVLVSRRSRNLTI